MTETLTLPKLAKLDDPIDLSPQQSKLLLRSTSISRTVRTDEERVSAAHGRDDPFHFQVYTQISVAEPI